MAGMTLGSLEISRMANIARYRILALETFAFIRATRRSTTLTGLHWLLLLIVLKRTSKAPAVLASVIHGAGLGSGVRFRGESTHGRLLVRDVMAWSWLSDGANLLLGDHMPGPHMPRYINSRKKFLGYVPGIAAIQLVGSVQGYKRISHVALAATIGDILESIVKRKYLADASGRLLPGYGGLLDRTDSLVIMLLACRCKAPYRVRAEPASVCSQLSARSKG